MSNEIKLANLFCAIQIESTLHQHQSFNNMKRRDTKTQIAKKKLCIQTIKQVFTHPPILFSGLYYTCKLAAIFTFKIFSNVLLQLQLWCVSAFLLLIDYLRLAKLCWKKSSKSVETSCLNHCWMYNATPIMYSKK